MILREWRRRRLLEQISDIEVKAQFWQDITEGMIHLVSKSGGHFTGDAWFFAAADYAGKLARLKKRLELLDGDEQPWLEKEEICPGCGANVSFVKLGDHHPFVNEYREQQKSHD